MFIGRDLVIQRNGVTVAGARAKTVTIDSSAVDVTTDDDSAIRALLEEPGQHQIDLSVEGLLKDDALLADIINGTTFIEAATILLPFSFTTVQAKIEGDFRFNNFEMGANYQEGVTFTATLQSSGAFTYTPAS